MSSHDFRSIYTNEHIICNQLALLLEEQISCLMSLTCLGRYRYTACCLMLKAYNTCNCLEYHYNNMLIIIHFLQQIQIDLSWDVFSSHSFAPSPPNYRSESRLPICPQIQSNDDDVRADLLALCCYSSVVRVNLLHAHIQASLRSTPSAHNCVRAELTTHNHQLMCGGRPQKRAGATDYLDYRRIAKQTKG